MDHRTRGSRILAAALVVALPPAFVPAPRATNAASLSGHVFASGNLAPVAGAVIQVKDSRTGVLYTSTPTDDKGAFRVADLPPATYNLAVEVADRGLFAAGAPVAIAPGQQRSVQVAVHEASSAAPSPEEARDEKDKGAVGFWENPLTATLVVLGSSIVLGVALEAVTDDDSVSQFQP